MIKGASVGGMLGGLKMARKPASMYRRLKGPAYTRRKYIGGVPNNRILAYTLETAVLRRQVGSQLSSNYVLTTTVRFDTLLLKQPVLFPTPPSVRKLAHKDTLSVSTPTLTTSCERTSKQPVLVLTVFPRYAMCFRKERRNRCSCSTRSANHLDPLQCSQLPHCEGCTPQGRYEVPHTYNNSCCSWRRTPQGTCLNKPHRIHRTMVRSCECSLMMKFWKV